MVISSSNSYPKSNTDVIKLNPTNKINLKRFKQNLSFDHGVQYISPKSKEFLKNALQK